MSASANKGSSPEKSKAKLYTVIGVIIAIAIAALIMWNNGVFQKSNANDNAVTIGDYTYSVAEVGYYYQLYYNNTLNMAQTYEQYGISIGYDTTLRPDEQMYDEERTYADYFRDSALEELQMITLLIDQAKEDSYTLSDEGVASVEAEMAGIDDALKQYSLMYGGSEAYYFTLIYGEETSKSLLKEMLTQSVLATEYANWRADQFTYDEAALNDYYEANSADLDSYDYRVMFISMNPEVDVDEEGEALSPTDEQISAAMAVAKQQSEEMVARVQAGEAFNVAAADYADESYRENYADPDYNLNLDVFGTEVSGTYGEWLKEDGRTAGELGIIESEDSGYYVVQLLARERRDNSYRSVNLYSMVFLAESNHVESEDGDEGYFEYTDEELAKWKDLSDEILEQWLALDDKTFEAMEALVPEGLDEGLIYYPVSADDLPDTIRGTFTAAFDEWAFTPGATEAGSTRVFELLDNNGEVAGYRLMYIESFGQAQWEYTAENALRDADYEDWYNSKEDLYPIVELDGMAFVGEWGGIIGGTPEEEEEDSNGDDEADNDVLDAEVENDLFDDTTNNEEDDLEPEA